MITSPDNSRLKTIRALHTKRGRDRVGLFIAEGEDLVEAAAAAGVEAEFVLAAGQDVEPELLDRVSTLGSGTRVIGVYPQRYAEPSGAVSVYLHGVADPGNVGTILRAAHAFVDGPVVLGPGCADPFGPKAVRASMGSLFHRLPARAALDELDGHRIALDPDASETLGDVLAALGPGSAPIVLCVGSERDGLPRSVLGAAEARARIPIRSGGPESLNAAMAATVALSMAAGAGFGAAEMGPAGGNRMADLD